MGIRDLQDQAEAEYGHQRGYSGGINSVSGRDFRVHRPSRVLKPLDVLEDYVYERFNHLSKREGEVIDLGIVGYSIAKPVVKEYKGILSLPHNYLRGIKEPAVLLDEDKMIVARVQCQT